LIRGTDTRVIKLEQKFGLARRDWSGVDVRSLSDAELSRAIYEMTGVPAAEQTEEVLERLAGQAEVEAHRRTRQ
jgi:hypothetical protein